MTLSPTTPNKSLDASGGSVFRNLNDPAAGALIRAAASTPPFGLLSLCYVHDGLYCCG